MADEKRRTKLLKKKTVWSPSQIQLLVELWEEKIGDLRGCRKNSHVYEEMKESFKHHGIEVTTDEIKNRIHNLTARYRKEKTSIGPSGGSPSQWPHYDKIHRILGSFRINNIESVIEDSIVNDTDYSAMYPEDWLGVEESDAEQQATGLSLVNEIQDQVASSPVEFSAGTSKVAISPVEPSAGSSKVASKRKRNTCNELIDEFKRTNERIEVELAHMRETDEKLIALEEERNEILKQMSNSSTALSNAIINYLNK
ncbi:uncharacterized protein LOC131690969 [Topomyia yanbarensis]|uniref:uncharacterized protein LOC131690969 n=1 Tax=Topomyia yanbarensis TaxID=2498891 RepID=UPI00273B9034|nr:uncharacterized protein LOC131690969 [Topomyia yanbarensis]